MTSLPRVLACLVALSATARAADFDVMQKDRSFAVKDIHVRAGDTVRFRNADEFDHQIYVDDPASPFESDEAEPGTTIAVPFRARGAFTVRCRIHPRMVMTVHVD